MPNQPLQDNQKISLVIKTPLDADQNPEQLPAGDTVKVTSSDEASATFVADGLPVAGSLVSGFIVAGKKLQPGVVITAQAVKADGTPDPSVVPFTVTVDIGGQSATALSGELGTPVAQ